MRLKNSLVTLASLLISVPALAQVPAAPTIPPAVRQTTAWANAVPKADNWKSGFSVFFSPLTPGVQSDGCVPVLDPSGNQIGTGRSSQSTLEFALGAMYDAVDLCKVYTDRSCVKFQPRVRFSAGGYVSSGMPYIQLDLGGHVEFYPGQQRTFAITGGFGTGYHRAFVPSLADQRAAGLALGFQKDPVNANTPVLYAELGGRLYLRQWAEHNFLKNLGVGVDLHLQNGVGSATWWATQFSVAGSVLYHF